MVHGVYVNGHGPYSFLLDTGTTANHLDPKLAQAIGLKATFRSQLVSSTGSKYVPGTDGVEVTLGSVHAEGQRFSFTGVDLVRQLTPGVQGVLGQTFLSHFDYLLNLRGIRTPLRIDQARPVVSTSPGALGLDSGTRWVTLFGVESTGLLNEMSP